MSTYQTETEIKAVVNGFESCETDKAAFRHQDHLTVAVCYLQELSVAAATRKLREALLRFLDHHQVDRQKYNETITVFWLEIIAQAMGQLDPRASLVEKCNSVIESFNQSALALEYYSPELLFSDRAREKFVKPDLKNWKEPIRESWKQ
jgi:hypothetical protein